MIKKIIAILACGALIAPVAFAQTRSTHERQATTGSYVLSGPGHVVNKNGEVIRTAIKPGSRVRVYYANMGDLRMVDRVVVD